MTAKPAVYVIRMSHTEKAAFQQAADAAGFSLAVWVRDRLRTAARAELASNGQRDPFQPKESQP